MVDPRMKPTSDFILQIPDLSDLAAQIFYLNEMAYFSLGEKLIENPSASSTDIKNQAKLAHIPFEAMKMRHASFHISGRDQIITSIPVKIPHKEFDIIWMRLGWLGKYACLNPNIESLTDASAYVAERSGLSPRQSRRFILWWCLGGPLALSSSWDPTKEFVKRFPNSGASQGANDPLINEICHLILNNDMPRSEAVKHFSKLLGCSQRTLWNYLKR